MKHQWWVLLLAVALAVGGSYAYIKSQTVTYKASAIVNATPTVANSSSSSSSSNAVTLPDPVAEVQDQSVVAAAQTAAPGSTLSGSTDSSGSTPNLLTITASASSAAGAVAAANAAANAYLPVRRAALSAAAAQIAASFPSLQAEIDTDLAKGGVLPGTVTPSGGTSGGATTPTTKPQNLAASQDLQAATNQLQTNDQEEVALSSSSYQIAIHGQASLASVTKSGNSKKVLEVAIVAGLLAGLGIGLIREQTDDRIRSSNEVSDLGSVAVLARLPATGPSYARGTIADRPTDEVAEAIRELRTALKFLSVERPMRTILVTSSVSGEGKSFVAANLAVAWALSGARTILVSSDLRAPSLEDRLGITPSQIGLSQAIADVASRADRWLDVPAGPEPPPAAPPAVPKPSVSVSELLEALRVENIVPSTQRNPYPEGPPFAGTAGSGGTGAAGTNGHRDPNGDGRRRQSAAQVVGRDLDRILLATSVENLAFVPAGPTPPNPAELLGSSAFADLHAAMLTVADIVILDSPPVLAITDAMVLSAQADGIVFVTSEGGTSRGLASRALNLLRSSPTPVVGAVVNRAARTDISAYYGVTTSKRGMHKAPAPRKDSRRGGDGPGGH